MRETWYQLTTGEVVDPNEVAPNDDGILCHALGSVAYANGVPRSRGVNPEEERAKAEASAKAKAVKVPEPKSGYKTRESRAR